MAPRLRVLLSAFAFAPHRGSEPGVGWQAGTRLAQHHDVTLLCGDVAASQPVRQALDAYFAEHPRIPGLDIVYVAPSPLVQRLEWLHGHPGFWPLYYQAYRLWQQQAFTEAQRLHRERAFDIVHHLNIATYREPGYLWRLPVPFFWGPVSGAGDPPLRFTGIGGARYPLRRLTNFWQKRWAARSRQAARKAELTWVISEPDAALIRRWGGRCEYQCEVGTQLTGAQTKQRQSGDALRLVWSGQHLKGKALPLVLRALAGLQENLPWQMEILGSGRESAAWQAEAQRLGLSGRLHWRGQLPQEQALQIMDASHALLHSSISEATGSVLMEALSLGLPVVCHDACGMKTAIDSRCGIKIPLRDPQTSVDGFRAAITRLANDAALCQRLSQGALERAAELTWERKVARISEAYLRAAAPQAST